MKNSQFIYLKSKVSDSNPNVQLDTEKFVKELDIESIDFDKEIFFVQSGGTEEIFVKIYKEHKAPYILIATDSNNSLPAALEIVSFLRSKKLECYLFHGTPSEVRENLRINYQNRISFNYEFSPEELLLKNARLGVVGEPSDWLIASHVNEEQVKEALGASLVNISFDEFKAEIDKTKVASLGKFSKYINDKIKKDDVLLALRIYEALKALVKKYKLNGLTVRCFDLLGTVHSTSCLALAILNDEEIVSSCEGDVPALISMMIIRKFFNQPSFQCNPSYINVEDNFGYFAHCTLPLKMTKSFALDTHFESGIGVGIHGEMNKGKITILKINSDLQKFSVFAGKIGENLYKNNLCRTQIKVTFDDPIDAILTSPCGNHLVVFYGNNASKLVSLLAKKIG